MGGLAWVTGWDVSGRFGTFCNMRDFGVGAGGVGQLGSTMGDGRLQLAGGGGVAVGGELLGEMAVWRWVGVGNVVCVFCTFCCAGCVAVPRVGT